MINKSFFVSQIRKTDGKDERSMDAKSMHELAAKSDYYQEKIRIAASKGKFYKIFPGGRSILEGLKKSLQPLGFVVAAVGWDGDMDVSHIKVSWA